MAIKNKGILQLQILIVIVLVCISKQTKQENEFLKYQDGDVANCVQYDKIYTDACVDCAPGYGLRRDCADYSCKNRCESCADFPISGCNKDRCGWAWVNWNNPLGTPVDKIQYIELPLCSQCQDLYYLQGQKYYGIDVPKSQQISQQDFIEYIRTLYGKCIHCMGNCKGCSSSTVCNSCFDGFTLQEKTNFCKSNKQNQINSVMIVVVFVLLGLVYRFWCKPYYHIIKKDRTIASL